MIWHSENPASIQTDLQTSFENGLKSSQIEVKLSKYGPNKLKKAEKKNFFMKFLDQMKNFMVIVLIIAAIVSTVMTIVEGENNWIEPLVIVGIVIINGILGVIQESKAENALEALEDMSAPTCKIIRDGKAQVLESSKLVPGDIVLLEAGDMVPADCRVLEAASLKCEESALTGESMPVEKYANNDVVTIAPLAERTNMVYSGCSVSYGHAKCVVVETGMQTEMGKIATLLQNEVEDITPLQKKLAHLGKVLGFVALGICAFIFVFGIFTKAEPMEMFMTSVSLAVAAIPEGLPAIVTIVLAMGVQKMVKKNAIIRKLPAVETLGSASVICSDKTGTLTQNKMTLTKVFAGNKLVNLDENVNEGVKALLTLGMLCNDGKASTKDGKTTYIGDPTETSIVEAAARYGIIKSEVEIGFPRIGEIPFDSDRKLMTTINVIEGKNVVIVKGAPDILINKCSDVTDTMKAEILKANEVMASDALRVLAIAFKNIEDIPMEFSSEQLENDLTFAGLVGMIDPPRKEAEDAIKLCKKAGIRPIMITGDNVITASAIAKQLGILEKNQKAISGAELANLTEEQLNETVENYSVYARVTPEDKIRIVKAWQNKGQIVSMTGDGVNDSPALKAADIGCAMGITGTDVAKGAADMVLTDDNFATIVVAIKEGRGIYNNIKKCVSFLLSCNIGEVITVFTAMVMFKVSPLMAIQLLAINLITDSLPALALGMEPVHKNIMDRKPRKQNESIFAGGMGIQIALQGLMFGALVVTAFFLGYNVLDGVNNFGLGSTMAFAVLAFSQIVHSFNCRSTESLFTVNAFSNKFLWGGAAVSLAFTFAILLLPPLKTVFQIVSMSSQSWMYVGILSVAPLVLVEIAKVVFNLIYKHKGK